MSTGERGMQGDHGQSGETGITGATGKQGLQGLIGERGIIGERGVQGDHGQHGEQGARGRTGASGTPPWVVRKAGLAYAILALGLMISVCFSSYESRKFDTKLKKQSFIQCQAGNERSQYLLDDSKFALTQAKEANIERILGLTKEQADELRRITVENAERRISKIPFLDCVTGERFPPVTP